MKRGIGLRRIIIEDYRLQYLNDLFEIKLIFYDTSRILKFYEFIWTISIRSSVEVGLTICMYKYVKEKLPSSPFVEPNRTQSFKLELIRNKYLKPFPKIFLTRIWNSVPMNIKCSLSVLSFKTNMKIYLASKYKEFKCKNRNCYSCNLKIL